MASAVLKVTRWPRLGIFPRVVILADRAKLTAIVADGSKVEMSGSFIARRYDEEAVTMQHIRSGHEITVPLEDFALRFKPRTL